METGKRPLVRRMLREGDSALDFFLGWVMFVIFRESRLEVWAGYFLRVDL